MKLLCLALAVLAVGAHRHEEDKTKVLSSPYGSHVEAFKNAFGALFSQRPTGRPDVKGFMKTLEKQYKDARNQLKGMRPTGRPHKQDHDLFHQAERLLDQQYDEAWKKVEAWKKQVEADKHKDHHHHKEHDHHKKHEHDAHKQPSKPDQNQLPKHQIGFEPADQKTPSADSIIKTFKDSFANMFAKVPTVKPLYHDIDALVEKKYREAKAALESSLPTDKHGHHHEDHEFRKAYDQLWKEKDAVRKQMKEWKKKVDEELRKQEEQRIQALIAASPFGSALSSFKQDFDKQFAGRPTGRPDVKGFKKSLEQQYWDARKQLKDLRPTGRPKNHDHDLFHRAEKLLDQHYDEAWEKVEAWKKQVEADKHKDHDHHKKHHHH